MPRRGTSQPPAKRIKVDHDSKAPQFKGAEDICKSLRTQDERQLIEVLTALRNQLTIRTGEFSIPPQDDRLLVARHWLESVPGARDLFDLWENANQRQNTLISAILSVLSALLTLLSSHYTFQSFGQPIIKALLSPPWMRRLNSYLGSSHNELILVTLKLFNTMSTFAGSRERKAVLEAFAWETKSLPKLLNMRRKTKNDISTNVLGKPDIRTLYVLFLLSFVETESPTSLKATFLERHRDAFLSIFKGLVHDPYPLVRKVLEVCWAGVWQDSKLKRSLTISVFNESIISHIIKLYDRAGQEGIEPDHIPADLAHHFLLAVCSHPGMGLCFRDRGWYPRDPDGGAGAVQEIQSEDATFRPGGRIHNKILANVLKGLKVNEDLRQQELAFKILTACPELVSGYWTAGPLTLEPRLSSKWITNISFFGTVVSLPVPSSSFLSPNNVLYHPTPPPLTTILDNILPSNNIKAHLSKGLQSSSPLVQHCTALALGKCLYKYQNVMRIFQEVAVSLEEDEEDGHWYRRLREVSMEVRKRVPDFQVIVGFSQQRPNEDFSGAERSPPTANSIKAALLAESAQRLLWLYHRCLPSVVAEIRFDVGKLLVNFSHAQVTAAECDESQPWDPSTRFHVVRQLHTLRLLKESDQFVWSSKPPSLPHSYLYILLKSYISTNVPAIRLALEDLMCTILASSIMFQEDADEPSLWLASLPSTRRSAVSKAPDGAPLSDEGESVITFLDDCMQRCLKTPYRYVDDMNGLIKRNQEGAPESDRPVERLDAYLSPLLMTVLEQLGAKISHKLLSISDILALATFTRKLLFRLITKQRDLTFLHSFTDRIDGCLRPDAAAFPFPSVVAAIRREVSIMHYCLGVTITSPASQPGDSDPPITFLNDMENLLPPESKTARILSAFQVVDGLRFIDGPVSVRDVRRLVAAVEHLHKPALKDLAEFLHPAECLLWDGFDIASKAQHPPDQLSFEWLLIQSSPIEIEACRDILVETLFARTVSRTAIKRALRLVIHRLSLSRDSDAYAKHLFLLLGAIMKEAGSHCSSADVNNLKEYLFLEAQYLSTVACDGSQAGESLEGFLYLVEATLDPASVCDRKLVAHITEHWYRAFMNNLVEDQSTEASLDADSTCAIQRPLGNIWAKYLGMDQLFDLLDVICDKTFSSISPSGHFLVTILHSLRLLITLDPPVGRAFRLRVDKLVNLRSLIDDHEALDDLISMAVTARLPTGHDGLLPNLVEPTRLGVLITRTNTQRIGRNATAISEDQFYSFLVQESWSNTSMQVICGFLYMLPSCRTAFLRWLNTDGCTKRPPFHLARVLLAFLDASRFESGAVDLGIEFTTTQVARLFASAADPSIPEEQRIECTSCIILLMTLAPSRRVDLLALLESKTRCIPIGDLTLQILWIGERLLPILPCNDFISVIVNHGLEWSVRYLSGDRRNRGDAREIFTKLADLLPAASNVKSQVADTMLTVSIKDHLTDRTVLHFLGVLVKCASLKPLIVNRQLQSILQHPKFFELCEIPKIENTATRAAIIHLIYILFNIYPSNTCHPTHVDPLIRVYAGTCSKGDREILSILQLFENQRKVSANSMITRWSPSPSTTSFKALDGINALDSAKVFRTCLSFPTWRRVSEPDEEKDDNFDASIYDPLFLILLFSRMLSECPPASAYDWVELLRTNVVGVLIRCSSSKDERIRELALCQIVALWKNLQCADMQEKPQVMYVLNILKNTLPPPSEDPPARLPSYSSLILLHALRGIFYPSNFIYPLTARFLLQRPELDTNDVPMLYGMLYSSSDDWKKERGWIIRFLSDGMMSSDDWRVLKKRHTWDLLASLFQGSENDRGLRNSILEVLANLTCNLQATMSLVLKSGLLTWIEMQLLQAINGDEGIAWLKILQNISVVANHAKLESVTNGEWRAVIFRCISLVLEHYHSSSTLSILRLAVPVILWLSLFPGPNVHHLRQLVGTVFARLERLEESIDIDTNSRYEDRRGKTDNILSLHPANGLHEHPTVDNPLQLWGESVEVVWRIVMSFRDKHPSWDALTRRELIWRSISGEEGSTVGEWARREVVRSLCVEGSTSTVA